MPGVNPGETVKPPTATGKLFPNVKVHQYISALIHSKQFIEFLAPDLNAKNLKFGICSKEKRFAICSVGSSTSVSTLFPISEFSYFVIRFYYWATK